MDLYNSDGQNRSLELPLIGARRPTTLRSWHRWLTATLCLFTLDIGARRAVAVEPGDIFVVTQSVGNVYRVDPQSGARSLISSGMNLNNPSHLLLDEQHRLLTTERSLGSIVRVNPLDGAQEVLTSGGLLGAPAALDFDINGDLIVGNIEEDLVRIDMTTFSQSYITFADSVHNLQDVDVDATGDYIVLDFGSYNAGSGKIVKIDRLTSAETTVAEGGMLFNPADLLIESSGDFLVSNRTLSGTQILRIDATTGAQELLANLPSEGFVALENDDTLVYVDFYSHSVSRVDLETGSSDVFSMGQFGSNSTGIAVYRPVPEPSTAVLAVVISGIAISASLRRRSTN